LKDKLGTISVPTGEVVLNGAEGYLVGEPERGFHQMTEMLNLERLHNAFSSVGVLSRALLESKAHAATREAFGETIDRYPLLRRDLAEMTVDHEAATAFVFAAARSLDRRRAAPENSDEQRRAYQLMRILVPVAKYRLGKLAVSTASEACEVLGGNGYVSGFTTERLLRDAQVLPIWEGTSNILSLDVLRALDREDAHEALLPHVRETLAEVSHESLADDVERVESAFETLQNALGALATADERRAQYEAKEFAGLVYDVVAAAHLLAHAQYRLDTDDDARESLVARLFVRRRFREGRNVGRGEAIGDDHYDAIARYRPVESESVL
jgi:acyl-CoA dehydrogenase